MTVVIFIRSVPFLSLNLLGIVSFKKFYDIDADDKDADTKNGNKQGK